MPQAARVDEMLARGDSPGPLRRHPHCHQGCARHARRAGHCRLTHPGRLSAPLRRYRGRTARSRGAVLLAKLNCDEFAMGSSNENSAYGAVRNPRALDRVPGGSSGGSAAAVAAGFCAASLGTDTGGSIRQPAAFCGVVGLLPTYGRVSRFGLIAFASSLDRVGPFTANVTDAATMLSVLAGHDPLDATSAGRPVDDYVAALAKPVAGLRVGRARRVLRRGALDPEIRAAVERALDGLRAQGCTIVNISLPHNPYAIPTYYVLATAEASSNLSRFDGVRFGLRAEQAHTLSSMYRETRDEGFGPEVKRRILLGTYVLSHGYYDAYYRKAQQVRALLTRDFPRGFRALRRDRRAHDPYACLQAGRENRRPRRHVPWPISTRWPRRSPACAPSACPAARQPKACPLGCR